MFNLSLPSLHVFCAEPKPRAMPLPMAVAKATLAMCMHKYCISIRTVLLNLVRLGFHRLSVLMPHLRHVLA